MDEAQKVKDNQPDHSEPDSVPSPEPTLPPNPTPEPTTAPTSAPTETTPKKSPKKIFAIIIAIIVALAFIAGGIFFGMAMQKQREEAQKPADDADQSTDSDYVAGEPIPDVAPIPESDDLTLAFLKLHNNRANSCYSPLSIRYALEMLRAGADSETKTQIEQLLGDHRPKLYANIPDHLAVANGLWISDALQDRVKSDYSATLKSEFDAELKADPFQSAHNINQWISDSSLGMLQDVLTDEEVSVLNAALVNVLAIDMRWQQEFMKESTSMQLFGDFNDEEDYIEATTMRIDSSGVRKDAPLYYNLDANATVLALDLKEYEGTQLQFVAIQPENLSEYINTVSVEDINQLVAGLKVATAQNKTYNYHFTAYIPKFSINGGIEDLVTDLRELGVTDAFDPKKADFSPMINLDNFAIDAATHKTKFDFSEEGIRAAAVTALGGMGANGGGPIPDSVNIVVSISGPFMYLVRDKENGEIWFVGTVYEPNLWEDDKNDYGW